MSRKRSAIELQIYNVRRQFRRAMETMARSHRGCLSPRGCKCAVDRAIAILETAEMELFKLELASYAGHELNVDPNIIMQVAGTKTDES
jgi:hypothetical protein